MPGFLCNGSKRWAGKIGKFAQEHGYPCFITRSVAAVESTLADLAKNGGFTGVLGGDGTLEKFFTAVFRRDPAASLTVAPLGDGTMEQCLNWLGWKGNPLQIARKVTKAYQRGRLQTREVSLLQVEHNGETHYGFMFLVGPLVRLLAKYDRGGRSVRRACTTAIWSSSAALTGWPRKYQQLIHPAQAEITLDNHLRDDFPQPTAIIASMFSRLVFDIQPFLPTSDKPEAGKFFLILSDWSPSEIAVRIPLFHRGLVPESMHLLNHPGSELTIKAEEKFFTVDGELIENNPDKPITVTVGPTVRLVTP
ncbi:MAG: hypothetical protein HQ530_02730 [Parcubacteria group bacterium]|nr:hypothetical protein [Parcubacteria group bacterium]